MKQETKEQVVTRLKRIEGQLRAVQKMVEEDTLPPKQVLIQVTAIISSLESSKIMLVEEYTKDQIMASLENLSELLR